MHDGKTIMSMCLLPFVLSEMHRRAPVTWIGLVIQSETGHGAREPPSKEVHVRGL